MSAPGVRRLLREPLLHFLLIGGALFALWGWRGGSPSAPGAQPGATRPEIVVTRDDVDQMNDRFARTWQRLPSEAEQKALVDDFVRNEIYCREALAIGLDRNDAVLKRQLRQKMEFVYENIASLAEPTDAELRAFMEKNRERYLVEPRVALRQVYFDTTRRGAGAESDARSALARLAAGAEPDSVGDRTMLEGEVPLSPVSDLNDTFGRDFGGTLLGLPAGRWAGPVRSGYGLHLVLVREVVAAHLPEWNEVRERVKRDWTLQRQRDEKDAAYAKLRERYSVTIEDAKAAAASPSGTAGAKAAR